MEKVGIVILNYKVKEQALKCLKSVFQSTYKNIDVFVVDNNSQDGIEEIVESYKDVKFIQSGDNLGYAAGNNLGIKSLLKESCDSIFILNPDTTVDPDCIRQCMKVMEDPQIGIVGPKILFDDKKTIWYAGGIFDKKNVLGKHIGVDEKDNGQYDKVGETDYVTGGAMFVRKEVFEKIGLFDENFFLYLEDNDFCIRAKQAGFKVVYNPKAVVYHANGSSTGLGSSLQDYFIIRNRFLIASKYLSLRTRFALIREAIRNIRSATRRQALLDYLLGNYGKGSFLK